MNRAADVAIAGTALLVSSPLLALAALAARLDDRGPVLYRQIRVGKDGADFELLKLRTMVVGAETMGSGHAVNEGDSRITRVGRILRKLSLDELPQLWNVIRGEMSVIGPRPTLRYQVERYDAQQARRLEVKPGITGWAQVHGRATLPWDERIALDVWYVEHRSAWLDLKILAKTPLALFGGTYKGDTGGWGGSAVIRLLGAVASAARRFGLRGAARAGVVVVDAVLLRARRPPLRAQVDGVAVRGFLRHRSFLAEAMRPRETYAELFQRLLRPGMTVVDGGAHVGLYTVLAARGVGPAGFVFAIEPDLYNLVALRVNVERAGAANIEVVAEALADGAGTARFYETRSTIGSSLLERDDAGVRLVRTTSVDLLLRGRDVEALLVKLNIEGAETLALAGMREVLARVRPVAILVEVNPPLLAAAGEDLGALVDGLRRARVRSRVRRSAQPDRRAAPAAGAEGPPRRDARSLTAAAHGELNDELRRLGGPLVGQLPPGRAGCRRRSTRPW